MKTTLQNQIDSFNSGTIIDPEGQSNTCFNFYDWFCKDSSLEKKATKLFNQVIKFVKECNICTQTTYVFFKNNCPGNGPLYDDFRICSIETGNVLFNVTAKSGHSKQAEIYSSANGFNSPLYTGTTLNEIYKNIQNKALNTLASESI